MTNTKLPKDYNYKTISQLHSISFSRKNFLRNKQKNQFSVCKHTICKKSKVNVLENCLLKQMIKEDYFTNKIFSNWQRY